MAKKRTKLGTCARKCKGKKVRAFRACVKVCTKKPKGKRVVRRKGRR